MSAEEAERPRPSPVGPPGQHSAPHSSRPLFAARAARGFPRRAHCRVYFPLVFQSRPRSPAGRFHGTPAGRMAPAGRTMDRPAGDLSRKSPFMPSPRIPVPLSLTPSARAPLLASLWFSSKRCARRRRCLISLSFGQMEKGAEIGG